MGHFGVVIIVLVGRTDGPLCGHYGCGAARGGWSCAVGCAYGFGG